MLLLIEHIHCYVYLNDELHHLCNQYSIACFYPKSKCIYKTQKRPLVPRDPVADEDARSGKAEIGNERGLHEVYQKLTEYVSRVAFQENGRK